MVESFRAAAGGKEEGGEGAAKSAGTGEEEETVGERSPGGDTANRQTQSATSSTEEVSTEPLGVTYWRVR